LKKRESHRSKVQLVQTDPWAPGVRNILMLALLGLLVYLPSLRAGFIWDDDFFITDNPVIRTFGGLLPMWTKLSAATLQYYPAVHTTFWLEYHLWGLWAPGYHVTNILLHIANSALLWIFLYRLGIQGGLLAGLIFLLHPVHVESVTWITERKNTLSCLFYLLSVFRFSRYLGLFEGATVAPASRRYYIGALFSLLLRF
jgi:hypothetical protein